MNENYRQTNRVFVNNFRARIKNGILVYDLIE